MGGGDTRVREPESQAALAEQAAIMYNNYRSDFLPVEMGFLDSVDRTFEDQAYADAGGRASTQIAGLYEQQMPEFKRSLNNAGFDPSSGMYQGRSKALEAAQFRGMGTGAADMMMSNTDQGIAGLTNFVRGGQNLETQAMQGNIDLAQNQLSRAGTRARSDFASASGTQGAIGTGVGMAAAYGLGGRYS